MGFWFATGNADSEGFSAAQLAALMVAALVAITLIWPASRATFMAAEAGGWFSAIILVGTLLGTLVPQLQIVTRPNTWWLPGATWLASAVLFVAALAA